MDEKSIYELRQKQKNGAVRSEAYRSGLLLSTQEMIEWLQSETGAHEIMIEAIIGNWVGVLRNQALTELERDEKVSRRFQNGHGFIVLGKMLQPPGWTDNDMLEYSCLCTGVSSEEVSSLLVHIGENLRTSHQKAFEPIGWFHPREDGFDVLCWNDFLQPLLDAPMESILGDASEATSS